MSRSMSIVGLKQEAKQFLQDNVIQIPGNHCPHCNEILDYSNDVVSSELFELWYGQGPVLSTYRLKDGRFCREVVQCDPWSSGPVVFLCLEIGGQQMFEWTDDEIEKYL